MLMAMALTLHQLLHAIWSQMQISSGWPTELLVAPSHQLGGGNPSYVEDSISIGAFHAMRKGIITVASAGNSCPSPGTVTNIAPWIVTVVATS
ncbi:hypothetical protein GYH30_001055 [Glycine max]|nr:hypothetical protein GYH30_001055 [Glycine max]